MDISSMIQSHTYNAKTLYPDQKDALQWIQKFINDPDSQVFILDGSINSGKSYLVPFIHAIARNASITEIIILAASYLIVKNFIGTDNPDNVGSMYSYIYGEQYFKNEINENNDSPINDEVDNSEQYNDKDIFTITTNEKDKNGHIFIAENINEPKILNSTMTQIPIKKCNNSNNALYIIDEAHLITDSFYQYFDTIFGTGYLLRDFLEFVEFIDRKNKSLNISKRKIIFIGDSYMLHLGGKDTYALNIHYLENRYNLNVMHKSLVDKNETNKINIQTLKCKHSIEENTFNWLHFDFNDQVNLVNNDTIIPLLTSLINNNTDSHVLCYSHEQAQTITDFIKSKIIKNGKEIAAGDLVIINNNINVIDEYDTTAKTLKIFNGQFATVVDVSNHVDDQNFTMENNKQSVTLYFREITLHLQETNHTIKVLSLENYRLSKKADLSHVEYRAYSILLNRCVQQHINKFPFEHSKEYKELISSKEYSTIQQQIKFLENELNNHKKVKTKLEEKQKELQRLVKKSRRQYNHKLKSEFQKDRSSLYFRYKNAAQIRFGWAITVHKAIFFEWEKVIFDVDAGDTLSKNTQQYFRWLYTGMSRAKQKLYLLNYMPITPVDHVVFKDNTKGQKSKEIFFYSNNDDMLLRQKELKIFIESKISQHNIMITEINSYNWFERHTITNVYNQEVVLDFYYNKDGYFKFPKILKGDENFAENVMLILKNKIAKSTFDEVIEQWRKKLYLLLNDIASNDSVFFEFIIQLPYKDRIFLFSSQNHELEVEFDYDKKGMIDYITAIYYNNQSIWDSFKNAILKVKDYGSTRRKNEE